MLAISDSVSVALIGMFGLVLSTLGVTIASAVGSRRRGRQAQEDRESLHEAIKPKNGHDTLGDGIAAIEERLIEGDQRFDRLDVQVSEALQQTGAIRGDVRALAESQAMQSEMLRRHLEEVDPLVARALTEWGPGTKGKKKKGA